MQRFAKSIRLALILMVPLTLWASEFQFKTIETETDLPENFSNAWQTGDYLIEFGNHLAILGGTSRIKYSQLNFPTASTLGSIISFVPSGQNLKNSLCLGSPRLFFGKKQKFVVFSRVELVKKQDPSDLPEVQAIGQYLGKNGEKMSIHTLYRFHVRSGKIDIVSTWENAGTQTVKEISCDIYLDTSTRYSFSPFRKKAFPHLDFRVFAQPDHFLGVLNNSSRETEKPQTLQPGQRIEVRCSLLVDKKGDTLLERIYREIGVQAEKVTLELSHHNVTPIEAVVRDASSRVVFYRMFLDDPEPFALLLPPGLYSAQMNAFPAITGKLIAVRKGGKNSFTFNAPAKGRAYIRITNSQGESVLGKVTFIGLDPTRSPYFLPHNPVKSGGKWEDLKNSCFPGKKGQEIDLPVGTYLVVASRGPEYTLDQKVLEVLKNSRENLLFKIDKVVDTKGFVSLDPHIHTLNSDGRVSLSEKIQSIVAEGVEVAVFADHNFITDVKPTLGETGLDHHLTGICGVEVSIDGMMHYNSYPLVPKKEETNNGAINPLADFVSPLFRLSRSQGPEVLIQINHPRREKSGYFSSYNLDPESAARADKGFDLSFDAVEVINGSSADAENSDSIKDWLHLLNRGHYFPLVASSDSHGIDKREPGYFRTYVLYNGKRGKNFDERTLIQAIKKGRSFGSNGPFVHLKINDLYSYGETLTDKDGEIDIQIRLQSAPWVSPHEVRLLVNGKRTRGFPVAKTKGKATDVTKKLKMKLTQDAYIIAEVTGQSSLYPVTQHKSYTGLSKDAIMPFALTNPVFVDVDGNGRFDPPLKEKLQFISKDPAPQKNHD